MNATRTDRPLTEKQQAYLGDLLAKVNDPEQQANLRHMLNDLYRQRLLTPAEASRQIDGLRTVISTQSRYVAPVVRNDIPVGRYAVENADGVLSFYRVRKDGSLVVMASDVEHVVYARSAASILDKIAEVGVEAAGVRFGQEIGSCYKCGRTLTDADSRAMGIGPTCASKGGF